MIFKAFTQGTLVRERGPEARATGVRWYVNAGRRPALLGCVAQRGPEARATGVRCTTRARGPCSWGTPRR